MSKFSLVKNELYAEYEYEYRWSVTEQLENVLLYLVSGQWKDYLLIISIKII